MGMGRAFALHLMAQRHPQTRQQLAHAEGLFHVVVRAGVQGVAVRVVASLPLTSSPKRSQCGKDSAWASIRRRPRNRDRGGPLR